MNRIVIAQTILTMDPRRPRAQAVAVSGDRIVAVGSLEECRAVLPEAEIIDTKAAALLPGFIDSHSHPMLGGAAIMPPAYWIAPWFAPTWDDVVAIFEKAIGETEPGSALVFWGFDNLLQDHAEPDAKVLDAIFGDRPVLVGHNSGHTAYVTTAVLNKLGYVENPPTDPPAGSFGRNADGSLDGTALEVPAIMAFVEPVLTEIMAHGHPLQGAVEFYALMSRAGITSTSDHQYKTAVKAGFETLAKLPNSPLRISLYHMSTDDDAADPFISDVAPEMLRKAGIKLWADGSPWVGNVSMSSPYLDTPVTRAAGITPGPSGEEKMNYGREQLDEMLDRFAPTGWQMAFHVNGDVALDVVLDAFDRALDAHELRGTDHRWRVEHVGGARADQFPRMGSLGVVPSMGPFQFYYWGDLLDGGMFSSEVGSNWQRFRDGFNAGLKVSFHNDGSVTPPTPLLNVQTAVTRRTSSGALRGAAQAVTLDEALRAETINAAFALGTDHNVGSLEVGKLADFVLLGADPYEVDPREIGEIEVRGTWLGGQPVDVDAFVVASGQVDPQGLEHLKQFTLPGRCHHETGAHS